MTTQTIIYLILIGVASGVLSGFVGVGGGIIIVPALIYFIGMGQHEAQGTSLFVLLLPVGIFAVMNYAKSNEMNWKYGAIIAVTFLLGAYIGSKLSLKMSPSLVKLIFGILMLLVSFKLIISGYNHLQNE